MKNIDVIVGTSLFKFHAHVFRDNKIMIQVDNVLNFFGLAGDNTMARLLSEGSRHGVMYTEVVNGGPQIFMVPHNQLGKWMSSLTLLVTDENHKNLLYRLTLETVAKISEETSRQISVADIWRLENEIQHLKSEVQRALSIN